VLPGAAAWVVTGRSAAGLSAQAQRLDDLTAARPELDPADVAWSLATTRSVFEHRAVVAGGGRADLTAGLRATAAGQPGVGVVSGVAADPGRVVFVFSGHGAQWAGMGQDLAASSPVFGSRLAECGQALAPWVDWSLDEVLAGDQAVLEREDVLQPALWAVSVALAAVWEAAGVVPGAVLGHSQGEVAAATVAGALSLADGAAVIALRSRALMSVAGQGGMLSVAEPADVVRDRIARFGDRLSVAVVNSPSATVVSGDLDAIGELAAACEAAGVRTRGVPIDYASHSRLVEAVREDMLRSMDGITPGPLRVPMMSAVTGRWLQGPELDGGYWYAALRSPVEFERAVRTLAGDGYRAFIEVSPHPVLTSAVTETLEDAGNPAASIVTGTSVVAGTSVVTGTLRRGDGSPGRVLRSLAEAFVRGVPVNWPAVLGPGQRVDLPTYAFQHQGYWARPTSPAGNVRSAGLVDMGHPLLGAAVELADGQGLVFTGRLALGRQRWLADQTVAGTVLLPGTAFVELAIRAGQQAGCPWMEELTMEAPLALPAREVVQLQVVVGRPDRGGRRPVELYSRPEDAGREPWTRHASGLLAPAGEPAAGGNDSTAAGTVASGLASWPPEGAEPVETGDLYDGLAASGYEYGPAFRGLRAVWRRGEEVFAEVALPAAAGEADQYWLHPALLETALHAISLTGSPASAAREGAGEARLPFSWRDVSVSAAGARVLRARLTRDAAGEWSLHATDGLGSPVVSVGALALRSVAADRLTAARDGLRDALFTVEWVPLPAPEATPSRRVVLGDDWLGLAASLGVTGSHADLAALVAAVKAGEPMPDEVLTCAGAGDERPGNETALARQVTAGLAGLVPQFLSQPRLTASRLVIVTRAAVPVEPGEGVADLAAAAARGLVRSAQAQDPGRLVLLDLPVGGAGDGSGPAGLVAAALATGEPELAVRGGTVFGRRLARLRGRLAARPDEGAPRPAGTVLVTGGTGTLGGLAARHLAGTGRTRHLILASRSGPAAPGAAALAAAVAGAGAEVRVTACDATDRDALERLLATIAPAAPLTDVIHAAGLPEAGPEPLAPDLVDAAMPPTADAAWNLHELTRGRGLKAFLLFSSAASALGTGGAGGGAAADAFLGALAARRRAGGLPATSLAWAPWALEQAGPDGPGDLATLSAAHCLTLLDAVLDTPAGPSIETPIEAVAERNDALLIAARLDVAGQRAQAARGVELPALWHGLTGHGSRLADAEQAVNALRRQLAPMPEDGRRQLLLDLVRTHVAAVLGHASPDLVEPGRAFKDLGFDSALAVELRNRLGAVTGLRLPATLVFNYPDPAVLAAYLRERLAPDGARKDAGESELRQALASVPLARFREAGILDALLQLAGFQEGALASRANNDVDAIGALDAEDLVRLALDSDRADFE
jgi:acyl transferase domain-containing protein